MPLIRKIIPLKTSYAITLPKSWLAYLQRIYGSMPEEVAIEVDDVLIIKPVPPEKGR